MMKVLKNTLYSIALPIGNNDDLSFNTKEVLSHLDVIACEDTRIFNKFIKNIDLSIQAKVLSYHEHNEPESAQGLIQLLQSNQSVGLVTDAGTPNISDPGFNVLQLCFQKNIPVIPLPGPSSIMAALSVCPLGGTTHYFAGFAPSKQNERITILKKSSFLAEKIIFFESPHRLMDHLQDAQNIWQKENVFIAREISKPHQEYLWRPIGELISHFNSHPPKGEFVIIYPQVQVQPIEQKDLEDEIKQLLAENIKDSEIAKALREKAQVGKKVIYDLIQKIKSEHSS